ncbi:MAG: MBL fold metallo-hydrolase [Chloroflexota bacterium]
MMFRIRFTLILVASLALAFAPWKDVQGRSTALLRVHFINVDQGDSILIQAPDGTTVLIDGGYDNGLAFAYLQSIDVSKLDAILATHPHADHIGGLVQVMQAIPTAGVWTSGAATTTSIFEQFLDAIADHHIPYHEVGTNGVIAVGSLSFDVVYGQANADNLNDTSLVTHLTFGNVSFLFTGDAEQPAEQMMLQTIDPIRLASTVLKVGHHGSYTSSSPEFLVIVQPQIAVYSAGQGNTYGHPHQSTLDALARVGATIYGTDKDGTIVVETDGVTYQVLTERGPLPQQAIATGTSTLTPGLPYDPTGPDRDCRDFQTHEIAQAFFIAAGGPAHDPHRLDGDNDGIACEALP